MKLLKWVGSKERLIEPILARIPHFTGRYIEPFVGGAAVYLALESAGRFKNTQSPLLTDTNSDLIGMYREVSDTPNSVAKYLTQIAEAHSASDPPEQSFTHQKDRFNKTALCPAERAAIFIYLNRCGFNGLCRYNKSGGFNTPIGTNGRKKIPVLPTFDDIAATSRSLRPAVFDVMDFRKAIDMSRPGDFIFFDPPYAPLSATSNFTAYTKDGFSAQDQAAVRDAALSAKQRGANVLISNSSADLIRDLYAGPEWKVEEVTVGRTGGTAKGRGSVKELLIS